MFKTLTWDLELCKRLTSGGLRWGKESANQRRGVEVVDNNDDGLDCRPFWVTFYDGDTPCFTSFIFHKLL
jgi:hypothetical protein